MKNILSSSIVCVFIFLATSCLNSPNENGSRNTGLITIDIDQLISNEPLLFSELFHGFQVVPLETKEECLFGGIDDLKFENDTLYIFDKRSTKSVFLFSKNGNYLNKLSRNGRGPGEYVDPINFEVDNSKKEILINDWANRRINFYDAKCNYLRDIYFEENFVSFTSTRNGIYTFNPFPLSDKNSDDYLIHQFDGNGNGISKHIKYSDIKKGPKVLSSGVQNFFRTSNDIKFLMLYHDTIFSIQDKTLKPFISFTTRKYGMTNEDINKLKQEKLVMSPDVEKFYGANAYSENKNVAFFEFYIGEFRHYYSFYYFNSKKAICSSRLVDDLSFINPRLFTINKNQLLAVISQNQISKFKAIVASGKIKLSEEEKKKILNISEISNPVVIIYDLKNN